MLAEAALAVAIALSPSSPTVHPMDTEPSSAECAKVGDYLSEWQAALELRDWTVGYYCRPDPTYGDSAEGSNAIDANERASLIYVHPKAPDQEEIAVHELVHLWTSYIREADSELVEEQAVRVLTRLLLAGKRCEEKVEP